MFIILVTLYIYILIYQDNIFNIIIYYFNKTYSVEYNKHQSTTYT